MIKDRPAHLLAQNDYGRLPAAPFSVRFAALPELLRASLGPLGGIQPVTRAMMRAANKELHDIPCETEIELFREAETEFQMVSVVLNLAHLNTGGQAPEAVPYAMTLIPASKRGNVDQRGIDAIAKLDVQKFLRETEPCYTGFDPFSGEWSLFAPLSTLIGENPYNGYLDELGMVVEQYFLATQYDPGDVLEVALGFANPKAEDKYKKHRARLLYAPFGKVAARRVWGAESPVELFLFQELLRRGVAPTLQMLIYDDGSIQPSLYHLWRDIEFRHLPGLITESDMYFHQQKIAVFCDSARHHRGGRARAKDEAIDARLDAVGIKAVRVPGKLIVNDVKTAGDLVSAALG